MNTNNEFANLKKQLIDLIDDPNNFKDILSVLTLQKMIQDKIYKQLELKLGTQSNQVDNWVPNYEMELVKKRDNDSGIPIFAIKLNGEKRVMIQDTMEECYLKKDILLESTINVGYTNEVKFDTENKELGCIWTSLIFGCQITVEEWNKLMGKKESPIIELPIDKETEEFLNEWLEPEEQEEQVNHVIDVIPFEEPKEVIEVPEIIPEVIEPEKPKLQLTEHQQERFNGLTTKIEEILAYSSNITRPPNAAYYLTTLEGAAGTGKTTMMVKVLEYLLLEKEYKVIFCSPTHQALGVIRETLRTNNLEFCEDNESYMNDFNNLIIKTLASFLGIKMSRDLENGKESFTPDPKAPVLYADVLAIDESSMISKEQLKIILNKLHIQVKCVLFIGDEVQLDSPSDNNESNGIFTLPLKYSLQEVVRQAADNKILQFAWEIREHILSKNCNILPTFLLKPEIRNNENILIIQNQQEFLTHYFNNPSDNKLISTYTNKIANEYNAYIRQMKLIGQGGKPLDIDIEASLLTPTEIKELSLDELFDMSQNKNESSNISKEKIIKPPRNIITTWDEYREFYIGEELVLLEPNTKGGDIIHQNGERIKILKLKEEFKTISILIYPTELMGEPYNKEFIINYWKITDENYRVLRVVKQEDTEIYNEVLQLLSTEANKSTGKYKWSKFYDFKERFVKVNKTFAFTLHKLQGSTCEDIYVDARDLDKFWSRMPIAVYKLIYIAATRPKQKVIFLI